MAEIDPALIERIYEATALPERWPRVLDDIADTVGSLGVCFVHRSPHHAGWVAGERMAGFAQDYVAAGWLGRDDRVPPVVAEQYPGFRVDADYWTEQQVLDMPVYRDFLLGRGLRASAACALQGTCDDALHVGVEGLSSYAAARSAVPILNQFRPHLARAVSLSAKLAQAHDQGIVTGLETAGVAAALVSRDGRLRASNGRFVRRFADELDTRAGRLRFAHRRLEARLAAALAGFEGSTGLSLAVESRDASQPCVIHLLPVRRGARDIFGWDGVLLLVAEPANASVPGADLLQLLFDLTPAEARLTRLLLDGRSRAEAAAVLGVSDNTARTHLARVFEKTGTSRQAELVRLLVGLGPPT